MDTKATRVILNKVLRLLWPFNENWNAHYSLHAHSMATNTYMSQRQFMRGLGTSVFLANVVSAPHGFKCLRVCTYCMIHARVYKPTLQPVASSRCCWNNTPCLDVQISTTHYQATLIFFNIICSTLMWVYKYDGM